MDNQVTKFTELPLVEQLQKNLARSGFTTPTPIQAQAIRPALDGKDLMGIAQTGTGKTLAFGLPMLQAFLTKQTKGLVVLPTRELALQVYESFTKISGGYIKLAVLIGGESMYKQNTQLRRNPSIIIATPGRLIDHMHQRSVNLHSFGMLVLDEADRMLDMGFAPQLKEIVKQLPAQRQTMLFSATMAPEIVAVAKDYLKMPLRVEVAPAGSTASKVTQEIFFVSKNDKIELLKNTLKEYTGSVLVFSRTKFGAKKLAVVIRNAGISSAEIHSNRSLNQRIEALKGFKSGKYRVLVATDIAARGIDVTGIELVINYDLPENPDDYVHRIGRTGRAGQTGHAISFATPDQKRDVWDIERLIKKQLPVSPVPEHVKNSAPQSFVPQFREDRRSDRTARVSHRTHRSPDSRGYRGGPSHSSLGRAAGQAERGASPFKSFGRPNRSARPASSRGRFSKNSFARKNTR